MTSGTPIRDIPARVRCARRALDIVLTAPPLSRLASGRCAACGGVRVSGVGCPAASLNRLLCVLACLVSSAVSAVAGPPDEAPDKAGAGPAELPWIVCSDDNSHFVAEATGERFVVWGVNYDHDADGRLLEDYWHSEWSRVEDDFREIRALDANLVRVHLQLGRFMTSPTEVNAENLQQLRRLIALAESTGVYLNLTGLGCYHRDDVPSWYDALDESQRWAVQARFWRAVAEAGRDSPAVFCYDLMNEPILPGKQTETEWLAGEFGGKHFVQRIALDLAGRTRHEVAAAWVRQLTTAIRDVDQRHLITVGVIPWALTFPKARPLFYSPEVGDPLDFVSVHFYPKAGEVDDALRALRVYDVGKPLVVEELFPLKCGIPELQQFIDESADIVDGWVSFYWGATPEEAAERGDLQGALVAAWLKHFREHSPLRQ